MKQYAFVPILFLIIFTACQPDLNPTPTTKTEEPAMSDVVTIPPRETATTNSTAIAEVAEATATSTKIGQAQPTHTATSSSTPSPTLESDTSNINPTVTSTQTATPTRTPTPEAILPSGATEQFAEVAGIGTTLPVNQQPITVDSLEQLKEVGRWGKGWVYDAAYTPDGTQMFVLTELGVYLYDTATATQLAFYPDNQPFNQLVLSPDGNTLVLSTNAYPYYIEIRDAQSLTFLHAFFPFTEATIPFSDILFDQTGQYLFIRTGSYIRNRNYVDAHVVAWNLNAKEPVATLPAIRGFDFAPQANLAVTNDDEGQLHLWQWENQTFTEINNISIPEDFYGGGLVAISPNGRYVALSQDIPGPHITVWQVDNGERLYTVNSSHYQGNSQSHESKAVLAKPAKVSGPGRDFPYQLLFSPDSQYLAATNGYYDLTIWQAKDGIKIQELSQVGAQMLFHPQNNVVAAWRHAISQWHIDDGSFINIQNQQIGPITDLELIPGQNQIAIASSDGFIYLRALHNGDLFTSLKAGISNETSMSSPSVRDIDITADGQMLVSASNGAYRVWNLTNGDMLLLSPAPRSDIGADRIIISYDGKYIYGAEFDTSVKLWIDQEKDPIYPNIFSPYVIAFSPINYMFATTTPFDSRPILMWPDSEEEVFLEPFGEDDRLEDLVFSANGRYLAGTSDHDALLIWEILDEQPQLLFRGGTNSISTYGSTAAFSLDNQIVAQSAQQFIRFWDMNSGELLFNLDTGVRVTAMTFNSAGNYLITGHSDGTVRIWTIQ